MSFEKNLSISSKFDTFLNIYFAGEFTVLHCCEKGEKDQKEQWG
jgi:hypothetical protein